MEPHYDPELGICVVPFLGFHLQQNVCVGVRTVLAENFKKLRDAVPRFRARGPLIEATGIPNGPLGRIEREESNIGIDYLDGLAKAFDVEPWQLLVPGLQVRPGSRSDRPVIASAPAQAADTPTSGHVESVLGSKYGALYDQLPDDIVIRSRVDAAIQQAILAYLPDERQEPSRKARKTG